MAAHHGAVATRRFGAATDLVGLASLLIEIAGLVTLAIQLGVDPNAQQIVWPSIIFWVAGIAVGLATLIWSVFRPSPPARLLAACALIVAIVSVVWAFSQPSTG
jgi:hypothetical protein